MGALFSGAKPPTPTPQTRMPQQDDAAIARQKTLDLARLDKTSGAGANQLTSKLGDVAQAPVRTGALPSGSSIVGAGA